MKITLNFKDVKKLIEESYDGINSVDLKTFEDDTNITDFDINLDVDGDNFRRKKETYTPTMKMSLTPAIVSNSKDITTKDMLPPIDGKSTVDYESLLAIKEATRSEVSSKDIAAETSIPLVKTLEEKNAIAVANGGMVTGRGNKRTMIDKTRG